MGKRCGNCDNGKWLNKKDAVPEICLKCEYVFGEPSNWKEKQTTNADHIRAMSDEELANFMAEKPLCPKPKEECAFNCSKCWLEWLKQPAETKGE